MPDIKVIRDEVKERLREVETEIAQLGGELEQLKRIAGVLERAPGRTAAPAAPRRTSQRKASGRPRTARRKTPARARSAAGRPTASRPAGGGGNRAQQALALITATPGMTAAELGESMGIKRNYLYRVLPRLEKDGKVIKQGKGYHPAPGG